LRRSVDEMFGIDPDELVAPRCPSMRVWASCVCSFEAFMLHLPPDVLSVGAAGLGGRGCICCRGFGDSWPMV